MNRRFTLSFVFLLLTVGACAPEPKAPPPGPEHTAPIRGTIVGRDAAANQVTLDHQKVEGIMDAMTMPFDLRGGKVSELPPDGSHVVGVLHEQDGTLWVSDLRKE